MTGDARALGRRIAAAVLVVGAVLPGLGVAVATHGEAGAVRSRAAAGERASASAAVGAILQAFHDDGSWVDAMASRPGVGRLLVQPSSHPISLPAGPAMCSWVLRGASGRVVTQQSTSLPGCPPGRADLSAGPLSLLPLPAVVSFKAPVTDAESGRTGTLDGIFPMAAAAPGLTFGSDGSMTVVDREGTILAGPGPSSVGIRLVTPAARRLAAGAVAGTDSVYSPLAHARMEFAYAPVPGWPLGVIATERASEVFADFHGLVRNLWIGWAVLALLAIAVGVTAGRVVADRHRIATDRQREVAGVAAELAQVMAASPTGIVRLKGAVIEAANPAFERLVGRSAGELIGRVATDITAPEDVAATAAAVAEMQAGRPTDLEKRFLRPDGTAVWARVRTAPLPGAGPQALAMVDDITADRERRAAVDRLAAVITASSEAVMTVDTSGLITSWNPGAEKLFGRTEDQAIGRSISEFVPADQPFRLSMVLSRLEHGEPAVLVEGVRVRSDGVRLRTSDTLSPIRDEDGVLVGISAICRDVTAERQLQDAVAASEARLRATLDGLLEGVVVIGNDGGLRFANPAAEAITGYRYADFQEAMAEGRLQIYEETGAPRHTDRGSIYRAILNGEPSPNELTGWRRPDGELRILRSSTHPLRVEDRVEGVIVAFADVTAERAAAIELSRAENELRRSFDGAVTGMALLSAEGGVINANAELCRILARPADDVVGERLIRFVHPDEQEDRQQLTDALRDGVISHVDIEGRFVRPDGTDVWARITNAAVRNADGEVTHFTAQFQDITARRAAAEDLRAANARFAALVEHSSDLVCVCDEDGKITFCSPASTRILGLRPARLAGRLFLGLIHPDDRARMISVGAELVRTPDRTQALECRVRHANGGWRHMEVVATNRLTDPDVRGIIANARDITERVQVAAQLSWQAFHDPLTGLANRALLLDRLEHAFARANRDRHHVALLYLDLDRFKSVNDSLGHAAGDALLRVVAERLVACVRPIDTVARLGGDEFVVLAEDVSGPDEAEALARRILEAIRVPVTIGDEDLTVDASIGIAWSTRHTPSGLLRDADTALLQAKGRGKGRWQLFEAELRVAVITRLSTEQQLRRALDDGLVVHYQPIVDLTTGAVTGAEALLRIQTPAGLRSPVEFLVVAEDTGLITTIGAGVLDIAAAQFNAWRTQAGDRAPRRISVNVSGRQLTGPSFGAAVEATLHRYNLHPSELALELTETTLIGADQSTAATLDHLHRLGVALVIDDFGTGYSSLAYLKRFPVSEIKVDREFVDGLGTDPNDTEIVKAVVTLGHALGLAVTAEGVETADQRDLLRSLGCDRAQGYLFSPAQPGDQLLFRGYDLLLR
jgi:diguanylate cyclase (GGDEF)-like protein/PAS domain S-box-containing protein